MSPKEVFMRLPSFFVLLAVGAVLCSLTEPAAAEPRIEFGDVGARSLAPYRGQTESERESQTVRGEKKPWKMHAMFRQAKADEKTYLIDDYKPARQRAKREREKIGHANHPITRSIWDEKEGNRI